MAVTDHPTAAWTAQQLRNAFPENEAPGYLLHDRDGVFAEVATTIAGMNIQAVRTAPRSPWQNAYVERVIGSIRRECLDHVIVVNAAGLQRVLTEYVAYYMRSRTHLALEQGRADLAPGHAAIGWAHRRDAASRRAPPPLRSRRGLAVGRRLSTHRIPGASTADRRAGSSCARCRLLQSQASADARLFSAPRLGLDDQAGDLRDGIVAAQEPHAHLQVQTGLCVSHSVE